MNDVVPTWYALRQALWDEDEQKADQLLVENPDLLFAESIGGETVLAWFAIEGDLGRVDWLYKRGFNLDVYDLGTPLIFIVAQMGHKELLSWLLDRGASLALRDQYDQDIYSYLMEWDCESMCMYLRELRAQPTVQADGHASRY